MNRLPGQGAARRGLGTRRTGTARQSASRSPQATVTGAARGLRRAARLPGRTGPRVDQCVRETPPATGHAGAAPARRAAAGYVCVIADGTLQPGQLAPSGAELARLTGHGATTCRQALRDLVAAGALTRPRSVNVRARVAGSTPQQDARGAVPEAAALSGALARQRRAAGLTQPELAARLEVSVTAVGHAEAGRLWQARDFWLRADRLLGGGLPRLYNEYAAAKPAASAAPRPRPRPQAGAAPALPAATTSATTR